MAATDPDLFEQLLGDMENGQLLVTPLTTAAILRHLQHNDDNQAEMLDRVMESMYGAFGQMAAEIASLKRRLSLVERRAFPERDLIDRAFAAAYGEEEMRPSHTDDIGF